MKNFLESFLLGLKGIMYIILILFMLDVSFSLRVISEQGVIVYPLDIVDQGEYSSDRSQPERDYQIRSIGPGRGGNV